MNKFIVLLFHSTDDRDLLSLKGLGNVHPDLFEKVLVSLKNEFDIVSLDELVECISRGVCRKERLLAITFDDGPKSYAINAVPLMESLGIPSACFLITGCIGDKEIYWRYLYNFCINNGKGPELADLIKPEYGISTSPEDIIRFTRNNYDKRRNIFIMKKIFEEIISKDEYMGKEGELFLSAKDIDILKNEPHISFGIHTHTHPVMMKLSDEEISAEISESLDFYRKKIIDRMPVFSIPFGRLYKDYDERTVLSARSLSLEIIMSAYGGYNRPGQPLYNIRRVPVNVGMLKDGISSFIRAMRNMEIPAEYMKKEEDLKSAIQI